MRLPCQSCKQPVETQFADFPVTERAGRWIEYQCQACGRHAYICERDYRIWQKHQQKEERR